MPKRRIARDLTGTLQDQALGSSTAGSKSSGKRQAIPANIHLRSVSQEPELWSIPEVAGQLKFRPAPRLDACCTPATGRLPGIGQRRFVYVTPKQPVHAYVRKAGCAMK